MSYSQNKYTFKKILNPLSLDCHTCLKSSQNNLQDTMLVGKHKPAMALFKELEQGFGSGAKFRILIHMILKSDKSWTMYALIKATGLRYTAVKEYIQTLVQLRWIVEDTRTPFSSISYCLNMNNKMVGLIYEFIKKSKFL